MCAAQYDGDLHDAITTAVGTALADGDAAVRDACGVDTVSEWYGEDALFPHDDTVDDDLAVETGEGYVLAR